MVNFKNCRHFEKGRRNMWIYNSKKSVFYCRTSKTNKYSIIKLFFGHVKKNNKSCWKRHTRICGSYEEKNFFFFCAKYFFVLTEVAFSVFVFQRYAECRKAVVVHRWREKKTRRRRRKKMSVLIRWRTTKIENIQVLHC